MLFRRICLLLSALLGCGTAFAAGGAGLDVQVTKPGAKVSIEQVIKDGKVLVSVVDSAKNPLLGLGAGDFTVSQAAMKGTVLSAQAFAENQEVPRHIVLVLDNSFSMEQRNAVKPLLAGVDELLKTVRPIDDVKIVVFDNKKALKSGGRDVHVKTFGSNQQAELRDFVANAYQSKELTSGTYLNDALMVGLDLLKIMPTTEPRFMVVFSDGEDLNSTFKKEDVLKSAKATKRFNVYGIDYMEGSKPDTILSKYVKSSGGQIWKATSGANIVPIFQSVASRLQHYYVINYQFVPTGSISTPTTSLKIDEVKTLDASPFLAHIFFDKGASEIPARYVRFKGAGETAGFEEKQLILTLQKYYQILNVIGKRLTINAAATITLIGCNDNSGKEKGNKQLSTQRAEAVKNYLQTVWNIAPERMTIEARNLPQMPSASKSAEGQAENRRVEIIASDMMILAPVQSVYTSGKIDQTFLIVRPSVVTPYAISTWKIITSNAAGTIAEQTGTGPLAKEIKISLADKDVLALGAGGDITIKLELQDSKGQRLAVSTAPVKVTFSQVSQRIAQKQDQLVQEKYALILFDFNKATIAGLNQEIIKRIAGRIKLLAQAKVDIVGHTDNIGSAAYNSKLSQQRAAETSKLLAAAYGEDLGTRVTVAGVGSKNPLFDNSSPEARSFNRTVTITLEYLSAE